jgi:hypothetical protein
MSAPALLPASRLSLYARAGAVPLGGLFGVITALGCAVVGLLSLDRLGSTFCLFRLATGLPCPTCGATRVLGRLARLDLAGALVMNPLMAAGALGLLVWGLADFVLLPTKRALRLALPAAWHAKVRILAVLALLLNWAFLLIVRR